MWNDIRHRYAWNKIVLERFKFDCCLPNISRILLGKDTANEVMSQVLILTDVKSGCHRDIISVFLLNILFLSITQINNAIFFIILLPFCFISDVRMDTDFDVIFDKIFEYGKKFKINLLYLCLVTGPTDQLVFCRFHR